MQMNKGSEKDSRLISDLSAFGLSFLILIVLGTSLVGVVIANPIGMLPTQPEPLIITMQSPRNSSSCLQEHLTVTFSLQNPTLGGADSITYSVDGQEKGSVNGAVTSRSGERFKGFFDIENYSATIDLAGLIDGWHKLTITASGTSPYNPDPKDGGSIFAKVSSSASIQFLFDISKPNIIILTPQNQTYTVSQIPLDFNISEQTDSITYTLDQYPSQEIYENTTLSNLAVGTHILTIYANDTIGRLGSSQTIYFTIAQNAKAQISTEQTSQTFPITALAIVVSAIAIIIGLSLGFLLYKRHRKHISQKKTLHLKKKCIN
jgi:hypothetical protein